MGIAGMILGIIAVLFGFIPVFGAFIAFPCIAVGLPLSGVGFYLNKKNNQGIGMSVAGLVTNIVALVFVILWITLVGSFLSALTSAF